MPLSRRNTSLSRSRLGLLWFSISQSVSTLHSLASSRRPTRAHVQQHKSVPSTDPNDLSTYDQLVTPAFVAALYKIPPGTSKIRGNSLGIFESELQKDIKNGTHPIGANIDRGMQSTKDLHQAGPEVALDLQLAFPIVYPQEITLYDVDDFIVQANQLDTYTFGFNTFLDALDGSHCNFSAYGETINDPNLDQQYPDPNIGSWNGQLMCGVYIPTNVISLSHEGQEADIPVSYQKRQCLEYMKLGLQGVSFLYASGDSGVSNYPTSFGGTDGPIGCLGPKGNIFNPTWPGTCPFVTSVRAIKVYLGYTVNDPESAVLDPAFPPYSSGGGFSNIYPIPDYQAKAVATYFDKHSPPYQYYSALSPDSSEMCTGQFVPGGSATDNRIGRGIPDVSANGDNDAVYAGGNANSFGGTSASTPIFSAVVTRLNEARLGVGKKPIGFLNPSLWDPVTGLGTPNYPKMLAYYLSLP
ncbi:peptidase S8/S53 domain-containing protein [Hyaloscypha sp. PMI_1271]|nr:peptidase S8/S53 domain-containing protein [Hyaloscypha sp. PMI_1271]